MAAPSAGNRICASDKIDPSKVLNSLSRWRRAVSKSIGHDPGAVLDQADNSLLMFRVFAHAPHLAELCMTHAGASATTLIDGPSTILAQAARDLASLDRGVGGPDALHTALAPLKNRADIAINLAELSGAWAGAHATAARVDFTERLIETALQWLVRSAVRRGELSIPDAENFMGGIFAVGGGDFAHEDLPPFGPLDLILVYDSNLLKQQTASGAERVFVRIGAEFRDVFEGKPGEQSLFGLHTPLGSGVGGAGFAASIDQILSTASGPQSDELKSWLATARIVAGDRIAGGAFLEGVEGLVWDNERVLAPKTSEQKSSRTQSDPRSVYRHLAALCRLTAGASRPLFRTASAREVFETVAESGGMAPDAGRRLCAGDELAHLVVSRLQMIRGGAFVDPQNEDEQRALSALCGYNSYEDLTNVLRGAEIDARNTLGRLENGAFHELAIYRQDGVEGADADKLEDLGFLNGESLSQSVDGWAARANLASNDARFSSLAPGLLTAFGQTQFPNEAVRLFDQMIETAGGEVDVFANVKQESLARDGVVAAFGCFGRTIAPLTKTEAGVEQICNPQAEDAPRTGGRWLKRYAPPNADSCSIEEAAQWRARSLARIAYFAGAGTIDFNETGDLINTIGVRSLQLCFDIAKRTGSPEIKKAAQKIALHFYDRVGLLAPGDTVHLGFIAKEAVGEDGEAFARHFLNQLDKFGEAGAPILPDTLHRPGGVTGVLVPTAKVFETYVVSEAIAHQQVEFARARVIAGTPKAQEVAAEVLRSAFSAGRRADMLFRDLDRARSQRMHRERASSDWDIDRLEGGRNDVELVISALIYRYACMQPGVYDGDVGAALELMARAGLISEETAGSLLSARQFWARLQTVRALANWSDPVKSPVRKRFGDMIARAAGVDRFEQVRPLMVGYADEVAQHYAHFIVGRPPLSVVRQAAS